MPDFGRASYEPIRSISATTFTGTYAAFGTPLLHSPFLIKVVNNSDSDILLSLDGSTDMDGCPAGGSFIYDFSSNQTGGVGAGQQFYIRGAVGSGLVWLVVMYGGA